METVHKLLQELSNLIPEKIFEYLPRSSFYRSLLFGSTVGVIAYFIFRKRYNLPPGPVALPLLGSPLFLTKRKEHLAVEFWKLSKIYGPVFTVYLGPFPAIVLNNIDVVHEALINKAAHFSDRVVSYSAYELLRGGQNIAFGRYGPEWKVRRKVAARAIRTFMVSGNLDAKVEEVVNRTVSVMLKEEGPFDPQPFLFYTTLNILTGMCFGTSFEYNSPEHLFLMEKIEGIVNALLTGGILLEDVFPPIRLYPTRRFRQFSKHTNELMEYVEKHVQRHKSNLENGVVTASNSDMVYSLFKAKSEMEKEGEENIVQFQDFHIPLIVFDTFLAGNDTSRQTLHWALRYVTAFPEVHSRIQKEVDRIATDGHFPKLEDKDKLHYTDAALYEIMRLGSVAPLGVPHNTSCDTKIGRYDVPKGSTVFINHWGLQNDPEKWDEPENFRPERFLNEDGQMGQRPQNWIPFSIGRRACLGESLVKPELLLILAGLLLKLNISSEQGAPISVKPLEYSTLYVPKFYKIIVKAR